MIRTTKTIMWEDHMQMMMRKNDSIELIQISVFEVGHLLDIDSRVSKWDNFGGWATHISKRYND